MKRSPRPASASLTARSARAIWHDDDVPSSFDGQPSTTTTSWCAATHAGTAVEAPYGFGGKKPEYVVFIDSTAHADTELDAGVPASGALASGAIGAASGAAAPPPSGMLAPQPAPLTATIQNGRRNMRRVIPKAACFARS